MLREVSCAVCKHRTPTEGHVCDPCRQRMDQQLDNLLRQLAQMHLSLVPAGGAADGPRVATSRTGSPTGARLSALSILGPGSDAVYARHLPDQVGELPPLVWLESWERMWRKHFRLYGGPGNYHAAGTAVDIAAPADPVRLDRRAVQTLLATDGGPAVLAAMLTVGRAWRAWREAQARIQVGMRDHGERRGADPLVDDWLLRFGPAAKVPATQVLFLRRFLPRACDDPAMPIGDFAAELRAVSYELDAALGNVDEKTWIGRCPTQVLDPATNRSNRCGAGLWQDPYNGTTYGGGGQPDGMRVQCPRCRTGWGPNRIEMVFLAGAIRQAWPVDRRRRYTTAEAFDTKPACPACGDKAHVDWREVTGSDDQRRWWQPVKVICPQGCEEAGKLL